MEKNLFKKIAIVAFLLPSLLFAVRPFVTDDARIIDYGQVEFEAWSEFTRDSEGNRANAQHIMGGVTLNNWFQIISGAGIGKDVEGQTTMTDFIFQPKILFKDAKEDGTPGLALLTGLKLPTGHGDLSDSATGAFIIGVLTTRLLDDWVLLHINTGIRSAFLNGNRKDNFQWGVGADIGVIHQDFRYIAELFSGDPFETDTPKIAAQTGFRYLYSDYLNFDITAGAAPEDHHRRDFSGDNEYLVQFGVRVLFDAFTKEGQKSRPWGPTGLYGER